MIADSSVRNLYYPAALPATWKLKDLKFDQQTLDGFAKRGLYDATNPDLGPFAAAGGRLLMWHGWADPHISPLNSIEYYEAMQKQMGAEKVTGFSRLFLFPGMGHCGGGAGPVDFDVLTPMMMWVERGIAPEQIIASHNPADDHRGLPGMAPNAPPHAAEAIDATRPVFAYPKVAHYKGTGSTNDAANFVAANPTVTEPAVDWLGARYLVPSTQQLCTASGAVLNCKPAR
jgi:feruloyl esterase